MAKQVLVVDDDKNTVKYLSAVLSDHGYEPVPAYNGIEGLDKIKQAKPDLIVLDVMMPKKTGFVLFEMIKFLVFEQFRGVFRSSSRFSDHNAVFLIQTESMIRQFFTGIGCEQADYCTRADDR